MIDLIEPHQGEHHWSVAFDDGDADARVCLTWTDQDGIDQGLRMAPSLPLFLWDLAQTGACWYQEIGHENRAGLRRTDLGWGRDPVR